MNTHDTNLGLLFGNFIHTQENSDVGYLFDRTIEESNEEWEQDFNDGKKIIIKMIPTNENFGQIDLTNISYDNYPEVIQFENYVIEKIKFFKDENIVNSIECNIPIGPTYVESFIMNGKNYDLEMCIGENQDELTIHLQVSFFNTDRFN